MFSGNLLEMNYNVIRETVDEIKCKNRMFIGKSPDFLFVVSFFSAPIKLRKIKLECLLQTQSLNYKAHKSGAPNVNFWKISFRKTI